MNLTSLITDNVAELLSKIIEFTENRQKLLIRNINNIHKPGFVPKDLNVREFCDLLNNAIEEHLRCRRLVMYDTEHIKFGAAGSFQTKPMPDYDAQKLLCQNRDEYLQLQIDKLLENSLNQRVAAELLKQKDTTIMVR